MNLLSPQERQEQKNTEDARLILKRDELVTSVNALLRRITELKDEERELRVEIKKDHDKFLSTLSQKKEHLEKEVAKLQSRIDEGMTPLDNALKNFRQREREMSDKEAELEKRESNFIEKEEELGELRELYEDGLSKVSDAFVDLSERERVAEDRAKFLEGFIKSKEEKLQKERDRIRQLFETTQKLKK